MKDLSVFLESLHGQCFFLNRVNSWLKNRKERTDINIITMGLSWNQQLLFNKYFGMRLYFLTIPKPLRQYTLFQKRLSIPLSWAEADIWVVVFTGVITS